MSSTITIGNLPLNASPLSPTTTQTDVLNDVNELYSYSSPDLKVYGDDALNNMIYNLLTTEIGTRHYEPLFGSNLPFLIWEPCDDVTAWQIETATYDAIAQWIPYIKPILSQAKVTAFTTGDGFTVYMPWRNLVTDTIGIFNRDFSRY